MRARLASELFCLCEREPSTSPAQAARPELLERGLLVPTPHGLCFNIWLLSFFILVFLWLQLGLKTKTIEGGGISSPNKVSGMDKE